MQYQFLRLLPVWYMPGHLLQCVSLERAAPTLVVRGWRLRQRRAPRVANENDAATWNASLTPGGARDERVRVKVSLFEQCGALQQARLSALRKTLATMTR